LVIESWSLAIEGHRSIANYKLPPRHGLAIFVIMGANYSYIRSSKEKRIKSKKELDLKCQTA
jgi:hypothetical protein